jgi:hypothetical protein
VPVRLNPRRSSLQVRAGFQDLAGAISGGNFTLQYNDYQHAEIEIEDERDRNRVQESVIPLPGRL